MVRKGGWGGRREQAMVGKEKKKTVVTTGFHGFSRRMKEDGEIEEAT